MKEIKVKNTFYRISNFLDLEDYFTKEHLKGHKFIRYEKKLFTGYFVFEECEPAEYIYKIDFCVKTKEETGGYLTMYNDFGWEHIGSMGNFSLFRQPKTDDTNPDIFSDNKSRAKMCRQILALKSSAIFLMMPLIAWLPNLAKRFSIIPEGFIIILLINCVIFYIIYIFKFLSTSNGLKVYIDENSNPLEVIEQENKNSKKRVD